MTISRLESKGSTSGLAARLVIEGCPVVPVSYSAMEGMEADGRERVVGLKIEGLVIDERVDLAHAELESRGMAVTIVERMRDRAFCGAFARAPDGIRYLAADLGTGDATLVLDSTAGVLVDDYLHIGTEVVKVGSVDDATTITLSDRAQWNTELQAHYAGNEREIGPQAVYIGRPPSYEGRRAFLYTYGRGDDYQGEGTFRWRGVITMDARLDTKGSWALQIDSLTELWKQDLGADLGPPVPPRGIYYPDSQPLRFVVSAFPAVGASREVAFSGFWETQEDFVADLNTWFSANIDGTLEIETLRAVVREFGEWDLSITLSATPADEYAILAYSPIDGELDDWLSADGSSVEGRGRLDEPTASTTYRIVRDAAAPAGAGQVPRGILGRPAARTYTDSLTTEARANLSGASERRLYLGGTVIPALVQGCEIQWADGDTTQHSFSGFDASDRWIEPGPTPFKFWTPATLPEIKLKRVYASGGLADFRLALITHSPTYANLGAMPFLVGSDLEDWSEATEAERSIPFAADRLFVAYEGVKLVDLLQEEFKLRAVFPRFSVSGRIGLARLRLPASTETPDHEITEATIPRGDGPPTWERFGGGTGSGSVNTARFRLGYNAATDEHEGREYVVRNRQAYADRKAPREVEIAPLSEPNVRADVAALGYDAIVRLAQPVLSVFGSPYATIQLPVTWEHFDALIGDVVSITSRHIPDVRTGTMGVEGLRGIVTGRTWELKRAKGKLTVLVSLGTVVGYAPAITIDDQNHMGSNLWTCVCTSDDPLGLVPWWQASDTISEHLEVGQRVRAIEWDSAAPSKQSGEITAIDDGTMTITVQFDGVWSPGTYNVLELEQASEHDFGSKASEYAFLGSDDAFIGWATGDERAEGFAP
jgi:hypothetical protein